MSVVEQYHKMKAELEELSGKAKEEALAVIHAAIETLNHLGHKYRLVEDDGPVIVGQGKSAGTRTGTRRTGIREEVLALIKQHGSVTRSEIIVRMDAKGNKGAEQSVSNALSALKKAGSVTTKDGSYSAS